MFRLQSLGKSMSALSLALLLFIAGCGSSTSDYKADQSSSPDAPASSGDGTVVPSTGSTGYSRRDEPSQPEVATELVYVTRTGAKFHRAGCQYLRRSQIPISRSDAEANYTPCSVCNP